MAQLECATSAKHVLAKFQKYHVTLADIAIGSLMDAVPAF